MKKYRYGKFRFRDYCMSWGSIALLLFYSIASVILDLFPLFIIFPMAYAVVWLWTILAPHCEQFVLCNDAIYIFHGKKTHTINLPSKLTLVVSYADICPPLAIHTAIGNRTHILKDKYAISILQKMPLDVALEGLHRNYVQKYTISSIQTVFESYRYIYSCVCDNSLIEELTSNREYQLIIPESLLGVVSIDASVENVHVDMGY